MYLLVAAMHYSGFFPLIFLVSFLGLRIKNGKDGTNSVGLSGKKIRSPSAGNCIPLQSRYLWESLRGGFNGKVPRFARSLQPQEASP